LSSRCRYYALAGWVLWSTELPAGYYDRQLSLVWGQPGLPAFPTGRNRRQTSVNFAPLIAGNERVRVAAFYSIRRAVAGSVRIA
jgi:hypothetical protein